MKTLKNKQKTSGYIVEIKHTRDELNTLNGGEISGVFDQVSGDLRPGFSIG